MGSDALRSELRRERQVWYERVLRGVAGSLCAAAGFSALWFAVFADPLHALVPTLMVLTLVAGVAALVPRLAFALRVWLLLGALFAACTHATLLTGYSSNPALGMATFVLLATLLIGRRAGLAAMGVASLTLLGISVLLHAGLWSRIDSWEREMDSARLVVGVRVASIFALLSTTMVIVICYLRRRADELWLRQARSLAGLHRERRERERTAQELERREKLLRKARELELLGRLAGSMAHDFNNCLLVIFSALDELSLQSSLPDDARRELDAIRAAADQGRMATRQLHAFGPMVPERSTTLELNAVVTKASSMLCRILPRNITVLTPVETDASIQAREGDVLRVLTNLALNARDAMPEGGTLTLRVRPTRTEEKLTRSPAPACVVIEVSDTGSGMSEEVQGHLFEPFFTTKQAAGTGLGLASVRDVVEGYGGQVHVTSRLGEGTTLSLLWPTVSSPAVASAPLARAPARPPVVLLVEDDAAVREMVRRALTRAGIQVIDATDGTAGIVAARRHSVAIDILCTDCLMHGLPVPQLIDQFRRLHAGRVIVCSGYAPVDTGLSPEMYDDFLAKPFRGEDLVGRIHALMQ